MPTTECSRRLTALWVVCLLATCLCARSVAAAGAGASHKPQETAEQYLEKARQFLSEKEYDEARKALKWARALNGDLPEVYFMLGVVYKEQFDPKAAIRFLVEAIQRRADYPEAHYLLAALYLGERQFAEAGREIDLALLNGWHTAEAYVVKGRLNLAENNWQAAVDAFEEALRRAGPDDQSIAGVRELRDRWIENIEGLKRFIAFDTQTTTPGFQRAQPLNSPRLSYTAEARKNKTQDCVRLGLEIDETGKVTSVVVFTRLGSGLDESAVRSVSELKFSPATIDGKAISCRLKIEVEFNLR